ncbi:unnamed protein product [Periconia digitata]|uniref:Rhodopsin domain-containing protein n=1 Tax=Periconia digitata TaxID=1303443 RepID=A0A9W4U6K6_9PLEO|nr:unnamed protein product [Periconia digitata]
MAPPKMYDLHADRGPILYASVWSVALVAILTLVGRFASRKMKGQRWLADDWAALVALILALGCCICATLSVKYGIGRHWDAIKDGFSPVPFWKLLFAFNQIYVMTGPVNKVAMLLMYRRIFITPFFRNVVTWGLWINLAWWIAMCVSGILTCIPVQAYWYTDTPGKKCFDLLPYDLGYAVVNISLDVFILVLPIREIWKLQLNRSQKIALSLMFLIGAFACVTALIRLLSAILYLSDPDFTWVYLDALIWTAVEPLVAVICICLPMLRPILSSILPRQFRLTSNSKTGQSSTSKQQNTLVTIGSHTKSRRINKLGMGYTEFDEAEEGSQKGLNTGGQDLTFAEDHPGYANGIVVRQSIELSHYPA